MQFLPTLSVVTHPKRSRSWRPATSSRDLGRRHLPLALYSLAIFGVPSAVVLATGGADTVGFWIVALFWVAAAGYAACVAVFVGFLALSPIVIALNRVFPDRADAATIAVARYAVFVSTVVIYLTVAQLGDASSVHLPGPWVNAGACVVIGSATLVSWGLWRLAGRSRRRAVAVAEPAEEFWSYQPVVGWRAWTWDGTRLQGVHKAWPTDTLEAGCRRCGTAPTWAHDCGIYATKHPEDVHTFGGDSNIVGRVEMWGDVIEHEAGFRASHARIVDLWVAPAELMGSLESAYPGVQVRRGHPRIGQEVN